VLRQYALATGAFPGGLAPRVLSRERSDYDEREWKVPVRPEERASTQCWTRTAIEPSWPDHVREEETYQFLAVDGGAMNNEPFELARQKLAGDDESNARSPDNAIRSILMVDPLPSERVTAQMGARDDDTLSVLQGLFGSLLTQARFKPDELILANSPDVYSRFLIAPKRGDEEHPIASGMLGGFGGFLKKEFRMHDFQLGRRNCQRFLQEYLVIPKKHCRKNPVFRHYSPEELDDMLERFSGETDDMMPIIPLVGSAKSEEFPLVWKTLRINDRELKALKSKIEGRAESIMDALLNKYVDGWFSKTIARWVASNKRDQVVSRIMNDIRNELKEFGLKR